MDDTRTGPVERALKGLAGRSATIDGMSAIDPLPLVGERCDFAGRDMQVMRGVGIAGTHHLGFAGRSAGADASGLVPVHDMRAGPVE